jgi:16S rRNA (guanine1207-N2)-methyltransferase
VDGAMLEIAGEDAALDSLFLPFRSGALPWPAAGEVRFLRARNGAGLTPPAGATLSCEQGFKPQADALQRQGVTVSIDDRPPYRLVLLLPPRQRDEARALYARALRIAAPGALVVASLPNNEGARSAEDDLHRLAGNGQSLSKNKCRVFWSVADATKLDEALCAQWAAGDAPQPIAEGRFLSRPGLFAWDRLDAASQLLVEHLPPDLSGHGADLGAGYGYLSAELCARCVGVTALDLFEADARALELARINLATASTRVTLGFHWHDVSTGLPGRYDFIVSNPPFHVGRLDVPGLGRAFITAAARALLPGGRLLLVANRHLPYEDLLGASFAQVRRVAVRDGFKLIEAIKGKA